MGEGVKLTTCGKDRSSWVYTASTGQIKSKSAAKNPSNGGCLAAQGDKLRERTPKVTSCDADDVNQRWTVAYQINATLDLAYNSTRAEEEPKGVKCGENSLKYHDLDDAQKAKFAKFF